MKPARAEELLKRFDLNHDGKLDDDELAAAHETMLREQMDRQAAQAARPDADKFRARMLEMFDKNHDGRLDDDERAEMRQYIEAHGLGENGEVRDELMKRFDKNADGKLDDAERAELEKFLQERRTQGAATMREFLLRQFDKNGNGKIDDDELPEFDKTMRARIEANPQQLARFDRNADGKIDDTEWAAARVQLLRLVNNPPPTVADESKPSPQAEKEKLDRIAAEVAQRRAERLKREQPAQTVTVPANVPEPKP
jgi:Ca2+-binding EF-hand superfamily protein